MEVKKVMNSNQEQKHTIQNMKDAGCSEDTINRFLLCYQAGDVKGELKVLSNHRQVLLDEVHKGQKEIDCLDYLVYQIEKSAKKAGKN
jgi:hypothetical protein